MVDQACRNSSDDGCMDMRRRIASAEINRIFRVGTLVGFFFSKRSLTMLRLLRDQKIGVRLAPSWPLNVGFTPTTDASLRSSELRVWARSRRPALDRRKNL